MCLLVSAKALERELGVREGTVAALVRQGLVKPVYLPEHKRPKYDRNAVLRSLGVADATENSR